MILLDFWLEVRKFKKYIDSAETKKIKADRDFELAKQRIVELQESNRAIKSLNKKCHNIGRRRDQFMARGKDEIRQGKQRHQRLGKDLEKARKRYDDKKSEFAGIISRITKVPEVYIDGVSVTVYIVIIVKQDRDIIELYYSDNPRVLDDPFHGHYIINLDGFMFYRRELGEDHGPEHHINKYIEIEYSEYAIIFPLNVYGQCLTAE